MKLKYERIAVLVAPWLLAASLPAAATGIDQWDNGGATGTGCAAGATLITSCQDTATVPTGGRTLAYSAISDTATSVAGGKGLAAAYVGNYNPNLGVTSQAGPNTAATSCSVAGTQECTNAPEHAMDNVGNSEFMLLSFSSAVMLNAVRLGYEFNDSDLTVLAYTGAGGPSFSGKSYGGSTGLVANGWTIIGNYANVFTSTANLTRIGTVTQATNINAGNVSSSYWLIGAYNSVFGVGLSDNNDYVKLLAVYGTPEGGGGQQGPARKAGPFAWATRLSRDAAIAVAGNLPRWPASGIAQTPQRSSQQ